ncbi:MAG: hypothetical protein PVJ34_15415 [Anaerolineae bacterium]
MRAKEERATAPSRGKRHPLLFQQRLNEMVFWPTTLSAVLCAVLLVVDQPRADPYRGGLGVVLAGSGLILIFSLIFRLRAYAQCRSQALHIQLPFRRLEIPYRQIRSSRPTELYYLFAPSQVRWTQRHFLRGLFGQTVVVVELESIPWSRAWQRLWMSPFMLSPETEGLILPVRDWMAFRIELDEFKARAHRRPVEVQA